MCADLDGGRKVRIRNASLALGAAVAMVLLGATACGGNNPSPVTVQTSASPTPTESEAGLAWENVVAFTAAVFARDFESASEYVSPGSPAERYITHMRNVEQALTLAGQQDSSPATEVTPDRDTGSVEVVESVGAEPYTWAEFVSDPEGRVISWTGAQGPVEETLWLTQQSGSALGQVIALSSAYRSNIGDLWVVVDVTPEYTTYVDYGAIYIDPSGLAHAPTSVIHPPTIVGAATSKVAYLYEGAELGGWFVYKVVGPNYAGTDEVRLAIA